MRLENLLEYELQIIAQHLMLTYLSVEDLSAEQQATVIDPFNGTYTWIISGI